MKVSTVWGLVLRIFSGRNLSGKRAYAALDFFQSWAESVM